MNRRAELWFGQGTAASTPKYWKAADVATDDGTAVAPRARSVPFYPMGRDGEAVFRMAYLSVTHFASALLRVTPSVEGTFGTLSAASGVLAAVPVTLTLTQQTSDPETVVYPVPLLMQLTRSGANVTRLNLRGVGLVLTVDTVGAIGNGLVTIDSCTIAWEPLAKAQHAAVGV